MDHDTSSSLSHSLTMVLPRPIEKERQFDLAAMCSHGSCSSQHNNIFFLGSGEQTASIRFSVFEFKKEGTASITENVSIVYMH